MTVHECAVPTLAFVQGLRESGGQHRISGTPLCGKDDRLAYTVQYFRRTTLVISATIVMFDQHKCAAYGSSASFSPTDFPDEPTFPGYSGFLVN